MNLYHNLVSDAFAKLNTQVHPTLYPFVLGQTLHGLRVSIVFQSAARRSSTPLSWGQWIVGYLIITWGGGLLANWLIGLPPPMLYSPHMVFNYVFVHLLATAFFNTFPNLLNPAILDTMLWPLDALLRTNGITGMVDSLSNSKVHLEYRTSLLTPLVVGAVVSSGGGVIVGIISGTTANWSFSTPPFLREGAGWDVTLDVWGGALVALVYGILIAHPPFSSIRPFLKLGKPFSRHAAKAFAGSIWGILFAAKAFKSHWLIQPNAERTSGQAEKDNRKSRMK